MSNASRVTERDARRVAEQSRQTEWEHDSFARQLYLGDFRPELVWESERLDPEVRVRGDAYLARLERHLRENVDGSVIEAEDRIGDDVLAGLIDLGVFGLKIPPEYGGIGLGQVHYNRALMLLGSAHPSIGALASAHQSIGVPEPVEQFGSEELKHRFLPRCAAGAISAFLLTEPDVGSDPARLQAAAVPTPEGDYLLDGVKLWTTNGVLAELLVVLARVPEHEGGRGGITAFVVEADSEGITVEHRNSFMGLRGLENGVTRFDGVRVPAENVVGREGQGLKIALTTLNTGRLSIPAMCVAGSKWALGIAREWSNARVQWGRPIGRHPAIGHKLAFMAATTYAQEAVVEVAGAMADSGGVDIRIEAALAKLWCSEMAWRVADDLVQIRGGRGYETAASLRARGERAVATEQLLRDLRINRIFEGSSEIMHLLIAREAVDTHLSVAGPLIDPEAGGAEKSAALAAAATFYAGWLPRLAAGPGTLPGSFREYGPAASHLRYVERASRRLARSTFYGMARWQGRLEHKQGFLARIVDIGAELFAMTAVWAHADREGTGADGTPALTADSPAVLADAFCRQSRRRIDSLFRALWINTDAHDEDVARRVLDGEFTWIEAGVIDPSAGTGPWIAEDHRGPSSEPNVRRRYRTSTVVR
ncbi:acyl-CoA dehydrogenase family protein [Pseudactinotalea sp. HY158]|uniref:acyl-CoA dehydrogenase family protein n=1 Tax=Pseudactinotalea sp. HY158 TaxID=2654547 RepID=UPI00129CF9B2|nr:acyl-CoA dehydrogenase family protein [Pseudactinotalea sp. HY158]QGH68442.1 acyl-CoA dehydrogenase [Pseudactinotalea sp. HY158]